MSIPLLITVPLVSVPAAVAKVLREELARPFAVQLLAQKTSLLVRRNPDTGTTDFMADPAGKSYDDYLKAVANRIALAISELDTEAPTVTKTVEDYGHAVTWSPAQER